MLGYLTLVPTPVGNLDDITLRAVKVLREADFIIAEDTRTSGILLKHLEIQKSFLSFHAFNEHAVLPKIIARLLEGEKAALVTDAGTPGISDPGFLLVRACIENNIPLTCLPGATAFVPALVMSGLSCESFIFEGFLPQKKGRQTALKKLAEHEKTIVLYESPHRLLKSLEQLKEVLGENRKISLSREISKLHEENLRGTIAEIIQIAQKRNLKGEFVLIVEGNKKLKNAPKNDDFEENDEFESEQDENETHQENHSEENA